MTAPLKPWESSNGLENKTQIIRNSQLPASSSLRSAPVLPPRPQTMSNGYGSYNSAYSPYSSLGNSYSYGSYGSMGWPGRSMYGGGYGGYGGYGYGGSYGNSYGMYGNGYMSGMGMGIRDDAESRFIQFAEESSRSTFANVEAVVRAFNGVAMMLDNTFFAMTSSFRAVLGVAENFGRLRSMFGHIWQAVNIFRLFTWLHRKLMGMLGVKISPSTNSLAWNEAVNGAAAETGGSAGSSWSTLAFFGILFSAPYFISKLLPKYEDKCDPNKWKTNGIPAKAVFDFAASAPNELTLQTNDEILLAPKSVQEEMRLSNSGWAYATCNGRTGVVPLNYIVIVKRASTKNSSAPRIAPPIINNPPRKVQKRVSFGETQIFEPPADIPQEIKSVFNNNDTEDQTSSLSNPVKIDIVEATDALEVKNTTEEVQTQPQTVINTEPVDTAQSSENLKTSCSSREEASSNLDKVIGV